ncbi:MAG: M3 family oligoendopeptidase [Candidatus Riflebacteria bacterium]|nr:M3 family oligoendopeptidase [Candidatus Riflebacteria bacterium]
MKVQLLLVFFMLLSLNSSFAQENKAFEPLPGNQKDLYRINFEKNFFKDEAAWKAEFEKAKEAIAVLEGYRGKITSSAKILLESMEAKRKLYDVLALLEAYGAFKEGINTEDRTATEASEKMTAEANSKTSFFKTELKKLDAEKVKALILEEPGLKKYEYMLMDVARLAPYILSEDKESVLSALYAELYMWQGTFFQKVFNRFKFPSIEIDGKQLDINTEFDTLMKVDKREAREQTFRMYYQFFAQNADMVAFALRQLMKTLNAIANLRGHKTYYHQSLFEMYLSREQIDGLYSNIEKFAPMYQEYQNWRMETLKTELAIPAADIWDMEMPPKGAKEPRFTGDTGTKVLTDALKNLGATYSAEISKFVDPKEGFIDIVGGKKRRQGAFCYGCFAFFMDNYQGFLNDVSTLAHEGGHAIHYKLVKNNKGSIMFGDGPNYMTESFAMFNEWVVRDYLAETETDPAVKATLKLNSVNEMMYLWELARRAKFEMVSYDRIASDEIKDEKGFNKACTDVGMTYDLFFKRHPELEFHWIRKHHYWTTPGYYVNYVIAHTLALKYLSMYKADKTGFAEKYVAMVSNGFDRPATNLLKDFLGIDFTDPKFLDGVCDLIKAEFQALKK